MANLLSGIRVHGEVAYVALTDGYVATIDAGDVELIAPYNWNVFPRGRVVYAAARVPARLGGGKVLMHRLICQVPDGMQVDHRDGDGLQNRRRNLRPATSAQQARNKSRIGSGASPYRGVSWNGQREKWTAHIMNGGKRTYLGLFMTQEEARDAYGLAAQEVFGEFWRGAGLPPLPTVEAGR